MSQKGFASPWIIVAGIILLVSVGLVAQHFFTFNFSKEPSLDKKIVNKIVKVGEENQGDCSPDSNPQFDGEFTDLSKINAINPIGGTQGGSPGRSYIEVKKGTEAPIYNPTDAVLESIIYARRGGPDTPGEYGLLFRVCDVTYLFDHIDKVSDKIKELSPKEPANTSRTDGGNLLNVLIKKGELLGYTDGTPQARTFDFLLMNRSKPATHINPARWQWEQAVYAQCPYDYFTLELKDKYYQKIGEASEIGGKESFIPAQSCGELSHDVLGTASGGWFKGESTDKKGEYLAINRQSKRVDISLKKDGMFGPDSNMRDYAPKVYPEDIKVGEQACYHDRYGNKWVYIQLVAGSKLSVAQGSGNCPGTFPTSGSSMWER